MINTDNKILIVAQARMSSSRLPKKIMMKVLGKELLLLLAERVMASKYGHNLVIATSTNTEDDLIEKLCNREGISCFRGHPEDCLDRHYQAGKAYNADVVVKIPSDCPLIDPKIINEVIGYYILNTSYFDYVSNLHPPSFPDGNDVEVIPMEILELAWKNAVNSYEREHTTPFIWDNPKRFRIGNVTTYSGINYSMTDRWTLDYYEDYLFIKTIYEQLYNENPLFEIKDILAFVHSNPKVKTLNKKYTGINWYRNHLHQLRTIKPEQTRILKAI